MARALKVFSTAAGFYEAVVAAPSRKAALAAWGVHDDLFASGAAREVDDPKLREEAFARPGEIVRVPIAMDAALVAAAAQPRTDPKPAEPKPSLKAVAPARPPPDRTELTAAEMVLRTKEDDRDRRAAELEEARRSLEVREAEVKRTSDAAVRAASKQVDRARRAYRQAGGVVSWRQSDVSAAATLLTRSGPRQLRLRVVTYRLLSAVLERPYVSGRQLEQTKPRPLRQRPEARLASSRCPEPVHCN